MNALKSIEMLASQLNEEQVEALLEYLEGLLVMDTTSSQITDEVMEARFSKGKICPHCESHEICRNGKYNDKQRYLCRDCGKTFTNFTFSPTYYSKKPIAQWLKYARCMISGYSLRKCAEIVEIDLTTSFYWRHKLLDAIRKYLDIGQLDGIIEADETFFLESFKGNHKKSKNFEMSRKPRKRGGKAKKRGISNEQVCVATAMDRNGNIILEMLCKGRMTNKDLNRLFIERIGEESILCTDSHQSYVQFAKDNELEHQRIKRGKHKKGIYHIQHVNSLHNELKLWIRGFRGVATKYLANYLYWFKWLQLFKMEKESLKASSILVHSNSIYSKTTIYDLKKRKILI